MEVPQVRGQSIAEVNAELEGAGHRPQPWSLPTPGWVSKFLAQVGSISVRLLLSESM